MTSLTDHINCYNTQQNWKKKNKNYFVMPISYILDTLPGHEGSRVAGQVSYYIVGDDEE